MTPGTEQVTYEFIGAPGCVSIQLTIDGEKIDTGELPVLRLDGRFGGAGGAIIGGEGGPEI